MPETGVLEIGRVSASGNALFAVTNKQEIRMRSVSESEGDPFLWSKRLEHKNKVSLISAYQEKGLSSRPVMKIVIPTYLESADDAHPVPSYQYAGYLYLLLDKEYFVTQMLKDIRSGKTGYAWAIDNDGRFYLSPGSGIYREKCL